MKLLRKTLLSVLITLMALTTTGCISPSTFSAGEEGVFIYKPWVFGHGSVDQTPAATGLVWTVWSTQVVRYNIKPVKITERFVDITASDNMAIDFNSYITLQIKQGKSPIVHEQFGENWYANNIKDYYRTLVRNEVRGHSSIKLRTDAATISTVQTNIHEEMVNYLKKIDLPAIIVKVVVGKVVPPDEVLAEAERTAAQKQRNATEIARAATELTRKQAETNKALADKAYVTEFGMTNTDFLRNKELDIMLQAINRTDTPVSLIMNASSAEPIFNAKR